MDKKWRVRDVEPLEGRAGFSGLRFTTERGLPCVSFWYQTEAKANAGRDHVVVALTGVDVVLCG